MLGDWFNRKIEKEIGLDFDVILATPDMMQL